MLIEHEHQIPVLLQLEKECFPMLMQENQENFEEFLADTYSSGLILYNEALPIGYVMGYHINEYNSLKAMQESEFIQKNEDQIFYISSLAILKEHRSVMALEFLIIEMGSLLRSIGYDYFAAYVRKRHGLSRLLSRRTACRILHTQENWEETGEPFDYCLVDLRSIPSLPIFAEYFFHYLRIARRKIRGIRKKYPVRLAG